MVEMNILPPAPWIGDGNTRTGRRNRDYEREARRFKLFGDRGEKIVIDMEKARLKAAGKDELSNKVEKAKDDSDGFDIHSFEVDGRDKKIEVKATQARVGNVQFFLTANELNKSS
jgi:hypothetical protein